MGHCHSTLKTEPVKVIYLGMAFDITSPLLLVPDVDVIYVIDMIDTTYGIYSWDGQKAEVRRLLEDGSDEKSECRCFNDHNIINHWPRSTIISDVDNDELWTLDFYYNGKIRKLIYYHHRNYHETWPATISGCSHVITIGAPCLQKGADEKNNLMKAMLKERCTKNATYWALSFLHEHFPAHIRLHMANADAKGEKIACTADFSQIPEL